ncbi:MAG: hypothetical protein PHU06_02565 [Gallionella sp.]|nr:hypothetical protein [Gallionella sp.]MDD4958298.1 hypothetical protein [Gallionella sp.]
MYFTKIDTVTKKIKAIYTGRFAFVTCQSYEIEVLKLAYHEASKDKSRANISILHEESKVESQKTSPEEKSNQNIHQNVYESIKEEFVHSRQLSRGLVGLSLNGFRWITRIIWLLTNNRYLLERYYEMRCIFYSIAYDTFENDASIFLGDGKEMSEFISRPLAFFKKYIREVDVIVFREWLLNCPAIFMIIYVIFVIPFSIIGFVITKHFTVYIYKRDDGNHVIAHLISNARYVSEITESLENKEASGGVQKILGMIIQPEYWAMKLRGRVTFEDWIVTKFMTECRFYDIKYGAYIKIKEKYGHTKGKYHEIFPDFETYLHKSVDIAFSCGCNQDEIIYAHKLRKVFGACKDGNFSTIKQEYIRVMDEKAAKLAESGQEDYSMVRQMDFFYLHGN